MDLFNILTQTADVQHLKSPGFNIQDPSVFGLKKCVRIYRFSKQNHDLNLILMKMLPGTFERPVRIATQQQLHVRGTAANGHPCRTTQSFKF